MKRFVTAFALGLFLSTGARADVALQPGSKLWLVGDSTMHQYHSEAKKLNVEAAVEPPAGKPVFEAVQAGGLKRLDVEIPVADMSSGKPSLDKNMQKSLKADKNPTIKFHMTGYETVRAATGDGYDIKAAGTLEVAGETKPVEIDAKATPDGNGVRIAGKKELLMTDFGVKPPSLVLIRTDNKVVINFDLLLSETAR